MVAIAACGAGLVLNGLISYSVRSLQSTGSESLRSAVIWAPFALVFTMNVALRAALVLPVDLRANWIFRLTEDDRTRAAELDAVVSTLVVLTVLAPLAMLVPLEWAVVGIHMVQCTSIAALFGLFLVEVQMAEWRMIPFTCSYAPSRQAAWLTMLLGIAAFGLFTFIGSDAVRYSIDHASAWVTLMTLLVGAVIYMRRQRVWFAGQTALLFEEVLPNEIEPLRLSEY
jgi:hypothetical protein